MVLMIEAPAAWGIRSTMGFIRRSRTAHGSKLLGSFTQIEDSRKGVGVVIDSYVLYDCRRKLWRDDATKGLSSEI